MNQGWQRPGIRDKQKAENGCARLDAANEVGEGGVLDEPRQLPAVSRGHQLHSALRYAARSQRLRLRADLVLDPHKSLVSMQVF